MTEKNRAVLALTKECGRFASHLVAVYFSVKMCTPWLAGRVYDWVLPLFHHLSDGGRLQFLFSHLFVFSFAPAFAAGIINYKYRHKSASFVWIVPTAVLAYQFLTFSRSVLENQTAAAYHQYFAGGFIVPEYRDYRDAFALAAKNRDMVRGIEQLRFTAPCYAGIAYSISSFLSTRLGKSLEKLFTRL